MGFEGTVRHPRSLNFRLFFGPFLHAVPLRLGLAEGALALAARPWRVFLVGFEGTVKHPPSVPVRSFFRRFLHAVPLRLGPAGVRPGWLRPGRALAALVLAAGLWLRGPGESAQRKGRRHPGASPFYYVAVGHKWVCNWTSGNCNQKIKTWAPGGLVLTCTSIPDKGSRCRRGSKPEV